MMEGQADEKADVAAKSARIFYPSKNNMYHVDRKRRLNLLSGQLLKGIYFFFLDLRFFEIPKILHLQIYIQKM